MNPSGVRGQQAVEQSGNRVFADGTSLPPAFDVALVEEACCLQLNLQFVALRILRNAADAEDVVNQVLTRLIAERFRTYVSERAPLKAYLTKCVRNECFKSLRGAQKVVPISTLPDYRFTALGGYGDTVHHIATYEQCTAVRHCLEKLKEGDRMLLILHYSEGHSIAQIMKDLEINESAAKVRLLRARERFLKQWKILQQGGKR